MENIKHYFDTYKESNEVFETSNGFLFHKESDAEAHAKTLEITSVKRYSRSDEEENEKPTGNASQIEEGNVEDHAKTPDELTGDEPEKSSVDASQKGAKKTKPSENK